MNSLKAAFTVFHPAAALKRLLIAALAVLLLGVLTALPARASGSGTWTLTGSLNVGRSDHTATLLTGGQVLVAGGLYNDYGYPTPTRSAELYDPSTGTWTTTSSMNVPRAYLTATLLPNGQVLVAGGENPDFTYLASAELYTPSTGTWTTTSSMNTTHDLHTATLLPNGQVLVAGGTDTNYAEAELYNPTTGSWTITGNLNYGRSDHTATLLPNGQVLAAGGVGGCGGQNGCPTTELYTP